MIILDKLKYSVMSVPQSCSDQLEGVFYNSSSHSNSGYNLNHTLFNAFVLNYYHFYRNSSFTRTCIGHIIKYKGEKVDIYGNSLQCQCKVKAKCVPLNSSGCQDRGGCVLMFLTIFPLEISRRNEVRVWLVAVTYTLCQSRWTLDHEPHI